MVQGEHPPSPPAGALVPGAPTPRPSTKRLYRDNIRPQARACSGSLGRLTLHTWTLAAINVLPPTHLIHFRKDAQCGEMVVLRALQINDD